MAPSKHNPVFENAVRGYVTFLYRKYALVLLIFAVIAVVGTHFVSRLKIKSDFAELLPENYQSVKSMKNMMVRIGSLGNLYIAIESPDFEANKRFAQDLAERMKKSFPSRTFKHIDYNMQPVKDFYEKNKYLYIDYEDLKEIHRRLEGRIEWEKIKNNPLYISLEDEGEKEKEFKIDDIIDKYKKKTEDVDKTTEGYYASEDGNLVVIMTRPYGSSTSVDYAKKLMDEINALAEKLDPERYQKDLKISFAGNFKTTLDEYDSLRKDILSTVVLCVILIGLSIVIYYMKIRFVFLIGLTVSIGTLVTFVITYFAIGYLNSQTAFLGSIIIGNGINYSIIFFARYLEERRLRRDVLSSLITTVSTTILATFTGSLATSASFATLLIAHNRGFSHFGLIGGLGMLMCWLTTYTFLPSLLTLTEKIVPVIRMDNAKPRKAYIFAPFSKLVGFAPRPIFIIGIGTVLISIALIIKFIPVALEMDFSKLRNKESLTSGTAKLTKRISDIFALALNPGIILADKPEQVREICEVISEKEKELLVGSGYEVMVDKCVSVYSFMPEEQSKKLYTLKKIKTLLSGKSLNFLKGEQREELDKFREQFSLKPIKIADLPQKIVKLFEEETGEVGLMTFVYPSKKFGSMWDGRNLIRFADLVREVKLKNGEVIYSSGSAVIFADMLKAISRDGPITALVSILAVILIIIINFRSIRASTLIITNLLAGDIIMGGVLALFDVKLNYFNFIAIPVTFGIGVDYAANIYQRYKLEGKGSSLEVVKTTGGAVVLCSATTIIGYAVLMIANNQALVSFGLVALIGEFTTLFAAIMFLPATFILLEKRQDRKKASQKENSSKQIPGQPMNQD